MFVGYSLSDIEVQKILFENEAYKSRVYFITSIDPSFETKFTLETFGKVLNIGVSGFADIIKKINIFL